jgi:hypothetical protein
MNLETRQEPHGHFRADHKLKASGGLERPFGDNHAPPRRPTQAFAS